jgi:hypothetical protein
LPIPARMATRRCHISTSISWAGVRWGRSSRGRGAERCGPPFSPRRSWPSRRVRARTR